MIDKQARLNIVDKLAALNSLQLAKMERSVLKRLSESNIDYKPLGLLGRMKLVFNGAKQGVQPTKQQNTILFGSPVSNLPAEALGLKKETIVGAKGVYRLSSLGRKRMKGFILAHELFESKERGRFTKLIDEKATEFYTKNPKKIPGFEAITNPQKAHAEAIAYSIKQLNFPKTIAKSHITPYVLDRESKLLRNMPKDVRAVMIKARTKSKELPEFEKFFGRKYGT